MTVYSFVLLFCSAMCLYRIFRGPTPPDIMVAVDIIGILVVGFCCLFAIETGKDFFMNIAISWSILSFIGTLTLAKYLGGKGLDE